MNLPVPSSSVIIFILTFCVGYMTLLCAYYLTDRLSEWFGLNVFDKTIQTFIIGGVIALISFIGLKADVLSLVNETPESYTQLVDWLSKNFVGMFIVEVLLIIAFVFSISVYLDRNSEFTIEYVS